MANIPNADSPLNMEFDSAPLFMAHDIAIDVDSISTSMLENQASQDHWELADASGYLYRFKDFYAPTSMMRFRCVYYNRQQPGYY
jgi:hypothetical protein